ACSASQLRIRFDYRCFHTVFDHLWARFGHTDLPPLTVHQHERRGYAREHGNIQHLQQECVMATSGRRITFPNPNDFAPSSPPVTLTRDKALQFYNEQTGESAKKITKKVVEAITDHARS